MRARLRRIPAALAALLVVASLGHVAWSLAIPAFNAPDEDTHIAYVQRIVETGELPQDVREGASPYSTELRVAQDLSGLYRAVSRNQAKPRLTEAERRLFEQTVREGTPAARRDDGLGFSPAANNPPLYYLYAAVPYAVGYQGDAFTRIALMRLAGLPLLLLTVAMAWLLVAELLPRPFSARVLGAGVVALHPGLGAASAAVNPDIMLAALGSVLLWLAVRTVRHGATARRAAGLGLVCGAAAMTQPRALAFVVPAGLALLLSLTRHPLARRRALAVGAWAAAPALVGFFVYYAVTSLYGGEATSGQLAGAVGGAGNPREFVSYAWQFYLPALPFMGDMIGPPYGVRQVYVNSFVGIFANQDVYYPGAVYERLRDLAVYGLVALGVCLILQREALRRHWRELAVLAAAGLALVALLHWAAYQALLSNGGTDPVFTGRYLLPLLGLFALAVALTCTTIRGRWGEVVGAGVLAIAGLLQLGAIGSAAARFYGG